MDLDESRTIDLALANNRTAKQTKWGYEAAKSAVSQVAAGKNLVLDMSGLLKKQVVILDAVNLVAITSPLVHLYLNPQLDASIDSARYTP